MSLLDKASLIVTPNAYKESKLYSVVPSSGAGDMTVVRATTATRVNSAGLIEVVPRNLLTYSEQFDNAVWNKIAGITPNATTAPNGSLTADKIIESATNNFQNIFQLVSQNIGQYTYSIYLKKGQNDRCVLFAGSSQALLWIDMTNWTSFSQTNVNSYSIDSVGDGWYRVQFTYTNTSSGNHQTGINLVKIGTTNTTNYLGNTSNGAFIWGSQLENFPTATEYFPTTTRLNIPRIDYTNGSCPSLLVEPQRTNLVTYSQNLNTNWVKSASTVETNSIISPDGTQNATKLNVTTSGYSGLYQSGNSSVAKFSSSIFAKKGNKDWLYFVDANGSANVAFFNLSNGTLGTVSNGTAKIEDYGNGWYRCTYSDTNNVTNSYFQIGLSDANNSTLPSSSGYGYVWGAQREVGTYPTSYIPTVASSVTRNADVISKTGIGSIFGSSYTIYGDFINQNINITRLLSFKIPSGGNYDNFITIYQNGTALTATGNNASSVEQFAITSGSFSLNQRLKFALRCQNNNVAFYINGNQIGVDTSCTIPAVTAIYVGNYVDVLGVSVINSSAVFNSALTDTELAQLTTL